MLNIAHITPHCGGGISVAIQGIIESIEANHKIYYFEETRDLHSLKILANNRSIRIFDGDLKLRESTHIVEDLIILHHWNSSFWKDRGLLSRIFVSGKIVVLNHQSIDFNSLDFLQLRKNGICLVQSGFLVSIQKKYDFLVPTCRSIQYEFEDHKIDAAITIGTLSYKKFSNLFFDYARCLKNMNLSLDIFGASGEKLFMEDLERNQNLGIHYKGFATNGISQIAKYKYLFYPLRPDHYGTTENVILEAMAVGTIPLILPNHCESVIVGKDILPYLDLSSDSNLLQILLRHGNSSESTWLVRELRSRSKVMLDQLQRKSVWSQIAFSFPLKSNQGSLEQILQ